jgi:hypothetical protein
MSLSDLTTYERIWLTLCIIQDVVLIWLAA